MGCAASALAKADDSLPLGADGQPIPAKPLPESETDQAALFDQLREQLGGPAGPFPGHLRKWKPEHYAAAAQAGYSERAVTQINLARARQAGRSWTDTQARRIGAVGGAVVSAVGSAGSAALGISPPTGWESLVQTGPAWSFSAELSALAVVLDQPYYPLGGTVTGAVALNLVAPMKSTGVYLKFKGAERCLWHTKHQRIEKRWDVVDHAVRIRPDGTPEGAPIYGWVKHTVTYYVDHEAHRSLLQRQIPLLAAGTIPAGQHLLPFRITLPAYLPPSCSASKKSFHKEDAYKAEVCYAIKAVCGMEGALSPNLRHDQELVLTEGSGASTPDLRMDAARGGDISARVVMEDSTQVAGKPVRFVVEVHNPPTKPVSSIKAKVMRELALVGDGKAGEGGNQLSQREEMCSKSFKGFEKGCGGGSRELELALPARLESSCFGMHVQSNYFLHVKCSTGLFGTTLRMRVPLGVCGRPQGKHFGPEHLPRGWAPKVAEPVLASLYT